MKQIIKPKDHLRKKRHRKPGELPENVVETIEKRERKEKEKKERKR